MNEVKKSGQGLVEYGLLLALIAVLSITMLMSAGDVIKDSIQGITGSIQQANTWSQSN